eukprot:354390-Chlamydomonas_euryale.AAC.4
MALLFWFRPASMSSFQFERFDAVNYAASAAGFSYNIVSAYWWACALVFFALHRAQCPWHRGHHEAKPQGRSFSSPSVNGRQFPV